MDNSLTIFQNGWLSGLYDGTICGYGSTKEHTRNVIEQLDKLFNIYKELDEVITINDAGAGDCHWISELLDQYDKWVDYQPYDIYPRLPNVIELDFCTELMRPSHMVICRDVMQHLSNSMIISAIDNFRQTSKWLIATTFTNNDINNYDRPYQPILKHSKMDLRQLPFGLGEPQGWIKETYPEKWLAIWRLK